MTSQPTSVRPVCAKCINVSASSSVCGGWSSSSFLVTLAALVALTLWGPSAAAETTSSWHPSFVPFTQVTVIADTTYPAVVLRGFGRVDGEWWGCRAPNGSAGVLMIHASDVDRARLIQAKYARDCGLLGGIASTTVRVGGAPTAAFQIAGQGVVVCLRASADVCIVSATTASDVTLLAEKALRLDADVVCEAEEDVPGEGVDAHAGAS